MLRLLVAVLLATLCHGLALYTPAISRHRIADASRRCTVLIEASELPEADEPKADKPPGKSLVNRILTLGGDASIARSFS